MAEAGSNIPVKTEEKKAEERSPALQERRPFESLRREIDRLFDDFGQGFRRSPFRSLSDLESLWSRVPSWRSSPAVDIIEGEHGFEVTAELPGMDENNIEVQVANGGLKIKGEKKEQKEERKKDYYLSERRYGSFERFFPLPEGVDADRIEASFKNGVLLSLFPRSRRHKSPRRRSRSKPVKTFLSPLPQRGLAKKSRALSAPASAAQNRVRGWSARARRCTELLGASSNSCWIGTRSSPIPCDKTQVSF